MEKDNFSDILNEFSEDSVKEMMEDTKVDSKSEEQIEIFKARMKDPENVHSLKLMYELLQYMFERMSKTCLWHEGSKSVGYSCDYDYKTDDKSRRDCLMNKCPALR